MVRYILITALSLAFATHVSAQDDDMYFTPKKSNKSKATIPPRQSEVTEAYDYQPEEEAYYSGSIRDVDEYNRRYRSRESYSQQSSSLATGQDSILVSVEDYENSMKMKRFDGYNNITLIVNDPWYYDPWYDYGFYWPHYWHSPWYYSWYNPWYYRPSWYGFWGGYHGWGFGYTWHNHHAYRPIGHGVSLRPNRYVSRNTQLSRHSLGNTSSRLAGNRNITRTDSQPANRIRTTQPNANRSQDISNSRQFSNTSSSRGSISGGGNRGGFGGGGTRSSGGGGGVRRR